MARVVRKQMVESYTLELSAQELTDLLVAVEQARVRWALPEKGSLDNIITAIERGLA